MKNIQADIGELDDICSRLTELLGPVQAQALQLSRPSNRLVTELLKLSKILKESLEPYLKPVS
jgi:hypothetical protein